MSVDDIIQKYYLKDSKAYHYLYIHSKAVAKKAIEIATLNNHLNPDIDFIREASMLHDIGIFMTRSQSIGCNGSYTYIAHGYLGRELLEKEGLPKHGLVCERHIGVGLSLKDIQNNKLPLPERDMLPVSIEEKIVCLADKFYSKSHDDLTMPKSINKIIRKLEKYGDEKVAYFKELLKQFNLAND